MSRPLLHVASSAICCLVSKRAARPAGLRGFAKYRGVNVVLLQDLGERGFLGDEVVVKPGYARNFLIPTKKAVYATPVNKDKHLIERTEEARRLLEERRDFLIFRERVERRAVTCTRTITLEGQTLEQPITKTQLAEMMRKQLKYSLIKEERLRLPRGTEIKQAGEYLVKLEMDTPELMKDAGAPPTEVLTIRVEVKRDETKRQLKVADAAEEGAGAEAAEGGKAGGKK